MILKTFLIFLVGLLGYSEWLLGTSYLQRPIILGPLVGLVLGDIQDGIIMGATLELAMIGAVSVGAYDPPDLVSGSIIGISLAIQTHAAPGAALTLGIPIAAIMQALGLATGQPLMLAFIHKCDSAAEKGNTHALTRNMLIAGYIQDWPGIVFIPLAFYFGSSTVARVLNIIPSFVQDGMNVAAGLLPLLGFAMLAQMMMNKKVAAFFFLGFFLVAYSGITTTGVAIFAVVMAAIMYVFFEQSQVHKKVSHVAEQEEDGFDEF
ncbi:MULTISPECIES: PTS mannose/fructose/sorbose/N-acetylgalactosamine transporter subunit IIC [unclassified Lactobacillus]|uniref:PTS mannose/fructose/sorbose/N-acetylgalactosamine transporter subunit IIC n=1 Tax=unclassified Lactobacillus TaxID=2620435 RepID=UPI002269FD9F|nr:MULTISPECIES: PTS sugar transporter subunit IIC [unclassified Lactobacillus]MCX8720914.1 PTS sugar transporter subunit IIC [Lactobacillus sp. B4010]MCX8733061.1 PTS sugar transporter subunit IIC [Lactobacillus sp. B4015]MCX8735219.1 PTS sugar transporter subunit IIC [Lactobacillus sp. B4012]